MPEEKIAVVFRRDLDMAIGFRLIIQAEPARYSNIPGMHVEQWAIWLPR